MNRLPIRTRAQIINCLVEGNSIRSTERMTDTHRDTVMKLLVQVGEGCAKIMDSEMRDLPCRRIQVDEIWAYSISLCKYNSATEYESVALGSISRF